MGDVFSGDELFSDTYPMKLVDDCIYEVYGKHETRCEGEIQLDGANAAAEVDTFKKNINGYMKDVLGRFKDLQFFVGESMDNDAMIMIMDYKDYQGEERPFLIAFKHGLEEEKV